MLHTLHRLSACLIGVFIVVHFCNHLFAVGGIDTHIAVMEGLRKIYRQPLVEVLLLVCVAFQIGSGLIFIKRRWGQHDLDTNFYFAVAGIHVDPFQYFFVPYYFFAVVTVFCHVACAGRWLLRERLSQQMRDRLGYAVISAGILASFLIMLALAGGLYPVEIPGDYRATYGAA